MCYTEKATEARHRLERQYNACANRKKQCRPNETTPYSNATHPRKRQNNPTNGHTPSRIKLTHTRLTYAGTRPHAPGTCTHRASQPVEGVDATTRTKPPVSSPLTRASASLPIKRKTKCLGRQEGEGGGVTAIQQRVGGWGVGGGQFMVGRVRGVDEG